MIRVLARALRGEEMKDTRDKEKPSDGQDGHDGGTTNTVVEMESSPKKVCL